MHRVPTTGASCLCVWDETAGKVTDLFADWLLHPPSFPNPEKLCCTKIQSEAAWMSICSFCAKFYQWRVFKNSISKLCIKCNFFKKWILEQKDFSPPQSFVVVWIFFFFSTVTCIFSVSLFFLAPWCVLVETKNQTPNAFSASGGLGYANLSWIAEELITLAYSSHTKETDLSSLPPVCLLRNSVLGWQYKAKRRKKWKACSKQSKRKGCKERKSTACASTK